MAGPPARWFVWEASNQYNLAARASDRDDRPDEIAIIRSPRGGSDLVEQAWETRTVPSGWRFGEKWEVSDNVGKFEEDPSIARLAAQNEAIRKSFEGWDY